MFTTFALTLLAPPAAAHPFSQDEYSMRTALKVSDSGLATLVVLEVPIPVVLTSLGVEKTDPDDLKRSKVNAWNASQWDKLAAGLTLRIDDKPVKGAWLPIEHAQNGKAAEGFFLYMVAFKFDTPPVLSSTTTIAVDNQSYTDVPMVLSASVAAQDGWTVEHSSARDLLESPDASITDPKAWSKDEKLRTFTVRVRRGA